MSSYDRTYEPKRTLAAIFPSRESARAASAELHDAGFRNVWLGVTAKSAGYGGETTLENEPEGFMESLGRFFSGEESGGHTLHEALIGHGLTEDEARRLDSTIEPGEAVVTVHGGDYPERATNILIDNGGTLGGGAGLGDRGSLGAGGTLAAGTPGLDIERERTPDDTRRLELREERLSVDKTQVQSGEARLRKTVVSEQQSIDVPVFHEELYVERRPARAGSATSGAPIGEGEEIRIPLTAERVVVDKRAVVTEEVAIGKRRVQGTQHVSDTLRHEELVVDDASLESQLRPSEKE